MNEPNNFALVRKPVNDVEKAAPRTKRILSGMAVDALALAKKKSSPRIVVVDDETLFGESVELFIKTFLKEAVVLNFDDSEKALKELLQTNPDLLLLDTNMARLSGFDILRILTTKKSHISDFNNG